ncbi:MAG TPA: MarR family transcriptional regulator [Candidatus Baltobacteraceae bacterium]|nr:MarR family transcriptional regulator [Candidatus Baltobacteraceae bacterium]
MQSDEETGRLFLHLKAAHGVMRAALTDVLDDIGITVPQLLILRAIELTPAVSSAQLARECFVSPQAMVNNVARLEADGLIARSKGGGRVLETHLTEKGQAILERAGSRIASAERYVTETLGEEQVQSLDASLVALTDCMLKSLVVTTSRTWDADE